MLCLKVPSDPSWAAEAAKNVAAVLVDHAHCEMKAASNALSLAARHPRDLDLVRALADLAREELEHFQRVLAILAARGIALSPPEVDTYAAELRRAATSSTRAKDAGAHLVDRLLIGALIEARSCERFKLLAAAVGDADAELSAFYTELFVAEARHYQRLVDLALSLASSRGESRAAVLTRLEDLAEREGAIVSRLAQSARPAIHG